MRTSQRRVLASLFVGFFLAAASLFAQSAENSGTITGAVVDSSSAAIPGATVFLQSAVSGFSRTLKTDATGFYQITNIPFNPYRVSISSPGFGTADLRVVIRATVPTVLNATLNVAANGEEVTVQAGGDLVENSARLPCRYRP